MTTLRRTRLALGATVAMAAIGLGGTALAAGFYLTEVGTPGSLGTAGAANPTNTFGADSSWTNPAGMTGLSKDTVLGGFTLVLPKVEFNSESARDVRTGQPIAGDDGGNAGVVSPIPSVFYVKPLTERARFGLSVVSPLGGGFDYGHGFVGRYSVKEVQLIGVGLTPSFGYKVNDRLSLGGGVSFIYTALNQEIMLRQPGAQDAKVKFEDFDDWVLQGILGLTYELTDRMLLGVVYRSEGDTDLEGKVKVKDLVIPFQPQRNLKISWTNPQWLDVGLRYRLSDDTMLFLNGGWQEWSKFSDNKFTVANGRTAVIDRNWDDTWYAGVAVGHKLSSTSVVSAGISYDSSPVEDEHRTLDFPLDRLWKLSASYAWDDPGRKLDYAVGATLYLIGDAAIDQTSQNVRVVGDFDTNLMLFLGGTLRYEF